MVKFIFYSALLKMTNECEVNGLVTRQGVRPRPL